MTLAYPFDALLQVTWRPSRPLDRQHGNPRVFVHLLDERRRLLRTFDHALPEAWTPGRPQSYELELYQSALAEPLRPGAYDLTFGLYDDSWGYRWPLSTAGPQVGKREYRLATIVVPETAPPAPTFAWTGSWGRAEAGSSKQIPARRCLAGEARLSPTLPGPGSIRLALTAEPGAEGVAPFEVTTSCRDGPPLAGTTGFQWIGIDVVGSAMERPCDIRLRPSSSGRVCLEALAWRPEGARLTRGE